MSTSSPRREDIEAELAQIAAAMAGEPPAEDVAGIEQLVERKRRELREEHSENRTGSLRR